MRKRIFAVLLAMSLMFSCFPQGITEEFPFSAFTTVKLRLRKTPSERGTILCQMPEGEAVLVLGERNDFYEVVYEGIQGYAMKKYLRQQEKPVSPQTPVSYETIEKGDEGENVRMLQEKLQRLGYYKGKLDGKCGRGTVQAVKNFQKDNGLKADGKAGKQTLNLLYNAAPLQPVMTPVPTLAPAIQDQNPGGYPYETTTRVAVNLRKGMSTKTKRITTIPEGKKITVLEMEDDYLRVSYGKHTGYVMAQYVNVPPHYFQPEDMGGNGDQEQLSGYNRLQRGTIGNEVRVLQSALEELDFYGGSMDGNFGSGTEKAVRAFQKKNGLKETGEADVKMQKLLFEGKPRNARGRKTDVKTLPLIPGITLQLHDKGDAIVTIQTQLQQLGYFHGMISETFDVATQQAVKNFQKQNGLYVDGKVGPKTQKKLASMQITPVPTPQWMTPEPFITPAPTMLPMPANTPITAENVILVHSGTRGMAVESLQKRLMELGYYTCKVDGIYDGNDMAAVRAFQKKNGLEVDGIAGLATQLALYSDTAVHADQAAATATPHPNTEKSFKIGDIGDEVKALQSRLAVLGFLKGEIDGMYGTGTAKAVAAFQRQNDLDDDGIAGTRTLKLLYSNAAATAPIVTPSPTPEPVQELHNGSSGQEVRKLQQRLCDLGYHTSVDGHFGTGTYNALVKFQKQNGLNHDGIAGPSTLKRLYSQYAIPAPNATVKPTGTPSVSQGNGTAFKAPHPSEVRYANWYTEIRGRAKKMPVVTLYDPDTGLHYEAKIISFGKHGDGAPLTKEDTAIMNQIVGINTWTPKAVWAIFSDGRVYLASTHSHGHQVDYFEDNGLEGHICIHFPRVMSEAEATGPYAVSHQKCILKEWEKIQNQLRRQ